MRRRNAGYHSWWLKRMKAQWSDTALSGDSVEALRDANSILEFDDRIVGPVNGFPGARAYYEHNSAERYLADIPAPTLLIHARNDPWIGSEPYDRFDWRANANLGLLLAEGGGHVGFHGQQGTTPWHCVCAGRFFEGIVRR